MWIGIDTVVKPELFLDRLFLFFFPEFSGHQQQCFVNKWQRNIEEEKLRVTVLIFCSEGSQMLKENEVGGPHTYVGPSVVHAHLRVELDLGTPDKRGWLY